MFSVSRLFIDTSVFLEYILPSGGYKKSHVEKELEKLVADAGNERGLELVTSHIVLGEALQVIHQAFQEEKEWKALFNLRKIFDPDIYELSTVSPDRFHDILGEVLDKDPRLSHNDCIIIAQAVAEEAEYIMALDKDWSSRLEDLGISMDIY